MFPALIPPSPPPAASSAVRLRPTCSATTCSPPPLTTEVSRGIRHRSASLYEVLRVKHTATITEIKAAYRRLAKVYHPDAVRLATEGTESGIRCGREFMEIHDAYTALSDPAARAVYDLTVGLGGRRRHGNGGRPTRRWETDQCW